MTKQTKLAAAIDHAVRAVPPVWPLASSVAVNPFLGQTGMDLATTGALLARVAGQPVTMERAWYERMIAEGTIRDADLEAALAASKAPDALKPDGIGGLIAAARSPEARPQRLPTLTDIAADVTGSDWPALLAERLGHFAANYFDQGQALWAAPKGRSLYAAWREVATHDLTPEIAGLTGFARHVADAPEAADEAIERAVATLGLPLAALPTYFHALLMSLGGWAQVARHALWQAELAGNTDTKARDLLAVRLIWEEALFALVGETAGDRWKSVCEAHAEPVAPTADLVADAILQDAADRAAQRQLMATFAAPAPTRDDARPALQAAFCIDVRSEVFRRALEAVDPKIETLGFAGFFGLTTAHRSFASDVVEHRLPVLLNAGLQSASGSPEQKEQDLSVRFSRRAKRAWGRFKLAAVSSFAFVEATGPLYAFKLVRDALGLQADKAGQDPAPRLETELTLEEQIDAANTVLRAMSLTDNFARIVMLAGHGANVINNPHASALHCGACGGYSGEVNARLLASLLNVAAVREGLKGKGIMIPEDTLFLAALHDTTTDAITLFDGDHPSPQHAADIQAVCGWLEAAGKVTRGERALRLPRAEGDADIAPRSRDWSETRPEWALAGCKAFIAAPRNRTAGKNLEGRAFLHTYHWQNDEGFGVLELIMTAPVVVASWISLQYYGSCVAPQAFGGGNKLLHNVVGGIGVVEGNGGLLRPGLPWQSVHDGERYAHDPLRLSVCIEAPIEAMNTVLKTHTGVADLFDNGWLHLFAIDANGKLAARYIGNLNWQTLDTEGEVDAEATPALRLVS